MKDDTQRVDLHTKKDPRGLVMHDIVHLRQVFKKQPYTPKMTMETIMHLEGAQLVIDYIETKMVARREDTVNGFATRR